MTVLVLATTCTVGAGCSYTVAARRTSLTLRLAIPAHFVTGYPTALSLIPDPKTVINPTVLHCTAVSAPWGG